MEPKEGFGKFRPYFCFSPFGGLKFSGLRSEKRSEKTLLTIKTLSYAPFKIENNEINKYDYPPIELEQDSNSRYFRECPLKFIGNLNRTCTFFKLF